MVFNGLSFSFSLNFLFYFFPPLKFGGMGAKEKREKNILEEMKIKNFKCV